MNHHPDIVLRLAQDSQRSKLDAAERYRLVRSVRTPRRSVFAARQATEYRL